MATWVALGALGELSPGMWEGLRLLEKRWASSKWGDVYVYHKLGPDFDVVIHSGSHVHVEFQPK